MPPHSLDFSRADYGNNTAQPSCAICTRSLDNAWFELDTHRICPTCADQTRTNFPVDTREKFLRSIAFGTLAAAISGLAYFYLFRMTNGDWMVFAAIGLGFLVGRAMRLGSLDVGGRRYQVAAAILTYCAIAIGTTLGVLGANDIPALAYPFLIFAPFIQLFVGQFQIASLQLLFAAVGIRWAWAIMAGVPWKISGPHTPPS